MDRINEILALLADEAQVAALSDDDLTGLRDELRTLGLQIVAGEIDDVEDAVATASAIADNYEGIQYVLGARAEVAQAQADALAAQAARLETPTEPAPEGDEPVDPPAGEAPPAPVVEVPAEGAPVPEPVGAAIALPVPAEAAPSSPPEAPALPALSTIQPPAANAPGGLATTNPRIMRLRDREYVDIDEFVQTVIEARESFVAMASDAIERIPLGRIKVEYPEDRQITGVDESTANGRLSKLLDNAYMPDRWNDALVASGGFCAPAEPDYTVPVISGSQRPLAGYLPTVGMQRGRKIVITPPTLRTIQTTTGTTAGSAVSIWTNANDLAPGSKPAQTVTCADTQTITAQAIVERLRVGNPMAMADPELVRAWVELAAAAWARQAEGQLLAQMAGFSTAQTTTQVLGVTNDFFGYLRQAAAAQRNRNRMPYNARLRAVLPAWFIDYVGSDLAHNHPGDGLERFTQDGEGFVRAAFNAANVNVTFHEDTGAGLTDQLFDPLQVGSDLTNFPPGPASTSARLLWFLFPEGTFGRGDAGTLDLGLVRDSTLNNTNDYELFSESWETIVPHVIESMVITSTVCATGAGAIDVASSAYCTAS